MISDIFLNVYLNTEHVGRLYDTTPLSFDYTDSWVKRAHTFPISTLSLSAGRQSTLQVQAFFENLLPEGELRDYIASQRQASSVFSLLRETAGDTVGAFILLPRCRLR